MFSKMPKKEEGLSTEGWSSERPVVKDEDEEDIKVRPHCQCPNCAHWNTSADWNVNNLEFEEKSGCSSRKHVVLKRAEAPPLLKATDKSSPKPLKMFPLNYSSLSRIDQLTTYKDIFIHSQITVSPIKSLNDTAFPKDIQIALKNYLNFTEPANLHSFVWAAMYKNLNICAIHGGDSNNFLNYLPIIGSFCSDTENYSQLAKYKGPLIIILCTSSKKCEVIYSMLKDKIFVVSKYKPKTTVLTYPTVNVNDTDILITMPTVLLECLKSNMFHLKRLYYLIVEDASTLLKTNKKAFSKICKTVNEMLAHRVCNQKVRLVLNSEKWTTDLENFLNTMHSMPFICFGDYLEAALYSKVNLELKCLVSGQKMSYLAEFLKKSYRVSKTIVYCSNDEIKTLAAYLKNEKIDVISIDDNERRIQELEQEFKSTKGGLHKVLLCSDEILNASLTVTNASTLVHYTFPETWHWFTKRFKCLVGHFTCPFNGETAAVKCKSLLLIDEKTQEELPKIFSLLHRLGSHLPEMLREYERHMTSDIGNRKIQNQTKLCDSLRLLGNCTNSLCAFRHLSNSDLDVNGFLPKNGQVTFRIIDMITVTHFTVQLIENADLDGNLIKYKEDKSEPVNYKPGERRFVPEKEIQLGTIYIYYDTIINNYFPCEVLENDGISLRILALNSGKCLKISTSRLHLPPKDFQWNKCSSIVEMRLANFKPPHNDIQFSNRAEIKARQILDKANYKKIVLTGDVNLQLCKTLWLDNITECLTISNVNLVKFNLIKSFLDFNLVEFDGEQLKSFQKLTGCALAEKKVFKHTAVKKTIVREVEPNWAFLDEMEVQQVYFVCAINPDEFYVRLTKFYDLLVDLENDILEADKKGLLKTNDGDLKISVGKYCLAPDPSLEKLCRCQVLQIEEDDVLLFYVDYGDEAIRKRTDLKYLPHKFLTKLPFQAIQCNLYGLSPVFEEWLEDATDVLYKYMLEPNTDTFRDLYVKSYAQVRNGSKVGPKKNYSVLLKDGFDERNILINRLLIECGLARQDFEINDFEIKIPQIDNFSEEEIEKIINENSEEEEEEEENGDLVINGYTFNEEDFDCEIFDMKAFLNTLPVKMNQLEGPTNEQQAKKPKNRREISTLALTAPEKADGYYKPTVIWSQTNENVVLKIQLIDVVSYSVNVYRKRLFKFETRSDQKIYKLSINLYKPVNLEQHKNCARQIVVTLKKSEANYEWPKLSETKLTNCRYEFSNLELDEPKRKRILEGIPDDSDSDNESDGIMYLDESEQDSEFEQEIDSDDY